MLPRYLTLAWSVRFRQVPLEPCTTELVAARWWNLGEIRIKVHVQCASILNRRAMCDCVWGTETTSATSLLSRAIH